MAGIHVLIYNGEGVAPSFYNYTLKTLSFFLSQYYDVRSVESKELLTTEWLSTTRLLVIPGGRDIPYCSHLSGKANANIKAFVRQGGSYLGICAGAYYASEVVEFEAGTPFQVIGDRELGFFPGKAIGGLYPSFNLEGGGRMVEISNQNNRIPVWIEGGCYFLPKDSGIEAWEPLFYYVSDHLQIHPNTAPKIAIVQCNVGQGRAILSGVHPEKAEMEGGILELWALLFERLRLKTRIHAKHFKPPFHLIFYSQKTQVESLLQKPLKDAENTFHLKHSQDEKGIICSFHGTDASFDADCYFKTLCDYKKNPVSEFGNSIAYAPVLFSTQTLLEKNPAFMKAMPNGFVVVASEQLSGRGSLFPNCRSWQKYVDFIIGMLAVFL